jgi:uracil-DNA glycosylase
MSVNANALSAHDAARHLIWLRDMGADEVILDQPINRFVEKPPPPKPVMQPPVTSAPIPKSPPVAAKIEGTQANPDQIAKAQSLSELATLLSAFDAHPLKKTASQLCFHDGAEQARVLVLVDRPRNEEDRTGQVLAASHEALAEKMLQSISLRARSGGEAEQVSLIGFIPWRPPGNRAVTDHECASLVPYARRAIQLISPKLILALGHLPGQWLAGGSASIARQRGEWMSFEGIPMISTFHPETLLKAPLNKRLAWHDLLALRDRLDQLP